MSGDHVIVGVLGVVSLAVAFLSCLYAFDENDLGHRGSAWSWFLYAAFMFVGGAWCWRAF